MSESHSEFVDEWGTFTMIPDVFINQSKDPYTFEEESKKLSSDAKWLFVILRKLSNNPAKCAWPGYDYLQEVCGGWRRERVSAAIKELLQAGWLEKRKRFGRSSIYVLKRREKEAENASSSDMCGRLDNKGLSANDSGSPVVRTCADYSSPPMRTPVVRTCRTADIDKEKKINEKDSSSSKQAKNEPRADLKTLPAAAAAKNSNEFHPSKFSLSEIEEFIKAKRSDAKRPGGLAQYLLKTGEDDEQIERWQQAGKQQKPPPAEMSQIEIDDFMTQQIEDLILKRDFIQLQNEYRQILARGGAKRAWEIRCIAWFDLNADKPPIPDQVVSFEQPHLREVAA
jgi:hypothetical protein